MQGGSQGPQRAADGGFSRYEWLVRDPVPASLASDSQFAKIAAQVADRQRRVRRRGVSEREGV